MISPLFVTVTLLDASLTSFTSTHKEKLKKEKDSVRL